MPKRAHYKDDVAFEDSLNDDWSHDLSAAEVPLGSQPFMWLAIVILAAAAAVGARIIYLNWAGGAYFRARAADNITQYSETPAPRGMIYDAEGDVLAESKATFAAVLDVRAYLHATSSLVSSTESAADGVLGVTPYELNSMIASSSASNFATPVVLSENLTPKELVNLQAAAVPTIKIVSDFMRVYPQGPAFSPVVGYVGRVTPADLAADPSLRSNGFIGKAGIEDYYDSTLRGKPGFDIQYENAFGKILGSGAKSAPQVGDPVHLTIDGGMQKELYGAVAQGLASLGRTVGLGLVMDPRTGAVLSLVNVPSYDDNLFSAPGSTSTNAAINALLTSPDKPLLDRIVNGVYNPGSTIKPLDAVGALADGVITPDRTIFSPGYLLVPNPYDTSTPTKYLDWQYQGTVDLASALAQSSDVYFYIVGGGSPPESTPPLNDPRDYGIQGLGISRLHDWWQAFGLGRPTGIDLPGEAAGFLPTPSWWQSIQSRPWLLGDTYNVAIGQGNLLLTPLQLLDYISSIANGGTVWRPFLNASSTPTVSENLAQYLPEIQEVQKGMVAGVASPKGTSHSLSDLPIQVCAKTGSAQIKQNTEENALFVGYAPCNDPQVALLILIENSKQGSLNAVPIAKNFFNWYYFNRPPANASGTPSGQ